MMNASRFDEHLALMLKNMMLSHDGHRSSHKHIQFGKGAAERVAPTAQRDSGLTLKIHKPGILPGLETSGDLSCDLFFF